MRLLLLIKLAYRTSVHATTGKIFFFANKGFEADIMLKKYLFKKFVHSADVTIEKIVQFYK